MCVSSRIKATPQRYPSVTDNRTASLQVLAFNIQAIQISELGHIVQLLLILDECMFYSVYFALKKKNSSDLQTAILGSAASEFYIYASSQISEMVKMQRDCRTVCNSVVLYPDS